MTITRVRKLMMAGLIAILAAACLLRWWPASVPRVHVLLITLDTTRWDRFGFSGHLPGGASPSPALDAVAREGHAYERAFCSVPLTLPSHATILTGLEPPQHGLRDNDGYALPDRSSRPFPTLTELLSDAGYRTAAVVSAQPLAASRGLASGFQSYVDVGSAAGGGHHDFAERDAADTTDRALEWLAAQDASAATFLWVHYFDPHAPYVSHPGRPGDIARASGSPYDGEIAWVDDQLERLFAAYRARALWDDTAVIVVADHGESLGEHREATHGYLAYDSTMRVPLVIKPPRALAASDLVRRDATTSDVFPTVLDMTGVDRPDADRGRGSSLLRPVDGPSDSYSETLYSFRQLGWAALYVYRRGALKLIDAGGGRFELYDTATDPYERADLAASRPDEARELARRLARLRNELTFCGRAPHRAQSAHDLTAGGYIQIAGSDGADAPSDDENATLAQPRERMGVIAVLDRLRVQLDRLDGLAAGDAGLPEAFTEAQVAQRRLDELEADNPAVLFWTGRALLKLGRRRVGLDLAPEVRSGMLDQAVARLRRYLAVRPTDHRAMNMILETEIYQADLAPGGAAITRLLEASEAQIRLGLDDGLTHAWRGQAYARLERWDEALAAYRLAVEKSPDRAAFRRDLERVTAIAQQFRPEPDEPRQSRNQ